jgi:hypothetical protein
VATSPRHVVIANGWSRSVVSRVPQTREASVRRCSIICVGRPADRSASRRSHRANKLVRSARLTTVDLRRPHLLFAAAERRNVVRPERRFLGRGGLVEFCPKRVVSRDRSDAICREKVAAMRGMGRGATRRAQPVPDAVGTLSFSRAVRPRRMNSSAHATASVQAARAMTWRGFHAYPHTPRALALMASLPLGRCHRDNREKAPLWDRLRASRSST